MSRLAVFGGEPVLGSALKPYNTIGEAEAEAVLRVVRSGNLSGFYGSWCDEYWGGPEVKSFEQAWTERFRAKHCVSVNSATSALHACMGAIGIGPGDEVIVPPVTMSATVMAPLVYGGIPVFADLEAETFGLDPESVRKAIRSKTKAILAVNLFGHPARLDDLMSLAKKHHLYLIEDNAQGLLAEDQGRMAGTVGHIGVFSLNYHKHIHTGEGGLCVTNDDELALRLRLIRNHGENVTANLGIRDLTNLVGFNLRLTELQAAIGREQLKRIDEHVSYRERIAKGLTEGLKDLEGLTVPSVRAGCRHVYYMWTFRYDEKILGVTRETFCRALKAEGFPLEQGYVEPLYRLPLFRKRVAMGREGFPFTLAPHVTYEDGICPVAERLYEKENIVFQPCVYTVDDKTLDLLIEAVRKVHRHRGELKTLEGPRKSGERPSNAMGRGCLES